MKKVGLLTFHASHNFGSVMQAYATQTIIEQMGYNCEIINFRMPSQKDYYSLYGAKKDKKYFLRNILLFPYHRERRKRYHRFEEFICGKLHVTLKEYNDRESLMDCTEKYDVIIAGSDQIWSEGIPEFVLSEEDFTDVYFLSFVPDKVRKVSYASSIGQMTEEKIKKKEVYLKRFYRISTREKMGAQILSHLLKLDVPYVNDPTFLLGKEQWKQLLCNYKLPVLPQRYILLYSLQGMKMAKKWKEFLSDLGKQMNMQVLAVSPFYPIRQYRIRAMVDAGPLEILNLFANADCIFTDTFHGTAFSIHFRKNFWSYETAGTKDPRKREILKNFHLEDRLFSDFSSIKVNWAEAIDYSKVEPWLIQEKERSLSYLEEALK